MAAPRFRHDPRGYREILQGKGTATGMRREIEAAGESVAADVRAQGIKVGDRDGGPLERDLPVDVKLVSTDRTKALVTITHAAGQAVQAKHGTLTKAAKQAGLDVKTR